MYTMYKNINSLRLELSNLFLLVPLYHFFFNKIIFLFCVEIYNI